MRELKYEFDLCVIGGGMSGLCCAIAAARKNIKVAIMQDRPVFGGNASSEIRMWICGAHGENNRETGIIEEIFMENFYRNPQLNFSVWDSVLYEKAILEPNLTLFLNCSCLDCEMQQNTIVSIKGWQLTTQTYHTIKAKYFADCSGDSILSSLSNAEFMLGREAKADYNETIPPDVSDKKTMGMSCLFQIRETTSPKVFTPPSWANIYLTDNELPKASHSLDNNFWWIELGGDKDSIHDTENIRDELLKIVFGVWDHMKNKGDHGCDNWELEWIGFLPGKRESIRYKGKTVVTQKDVETGGKFDDIIAYGGWSMDDHFPQGFNYRNGHPTIYHPAPSPWGIPLSSLISNNISNLVFAGRNISVTHAALSSSRVMATCAILGQALGSGVAKAINENKKITDIDVSELQKELMFDDCYIPYCERETSIKTKNSKVNYEIIRNGKDRGNENLWIGKKGDYIEFTFDIPTEVDSLRIIFDSDLNREYQNMPCSYPLKEKRFKLPKTLIKDYNVEMILEDNTKETIEMKNSHNRFIILPILKKVKSIKLLPLSTWGEENFRIFSVDIC